ncbi:hypothetical protein [Stenoxybacter acetivorans]|uniref:hypothetical protein n=1 Tax=Stenoxybacter acetivorans TaxID=422441 RepID=UPI0005643A96|nr:hypothetical protein [Stenoxybacter acetivorans]
MFKKPEEVIMAILALLWVLLTYFLCRCAAMPIHTLLFITLFTFIWAVSFFLLWQRNLTRFIWPLFLGLLVACWWPALDWLAEKNLLLPQVANQTLIINLPWYATWTAKSIYALVPVIVGYLIMWKLNHRPKPDISMP